MQEKTTNDFVTTSSNCKPFEQATQKNIEDAIAELKKPQFGRNINYSKMLLRNVDDVKVLFDDKKKINTFFGCEVITSKSLPKYKVYLTNKKCDNIIVLDFTPNHFKVFKDIKKYAKSLWFKVVNTFNRRKYNVREKSGK